MRSPSSLRAPLRVLVKGSDPATTVAGGAPAGRSPAASADDLTYAWVLERGLLDSGRNAAVRNLAVPGERVATGVRNWEHQVFPWSPDVVVLHYGHVEAAGRGPTLRSPRWTARFTEDLAMLVKRCVYVSNPLVLLPVLPGEGDRVRAVNDALTAVVERFDLDNVRVLDTDDAPAEAGVFTAEGHAVLGRRLTELVGPWCDQHVPV